LVRFQNILTFPIGPFRGGLFPIHVDHPANDKDVDRGWSRRRRLNPLLDLDAVLGEQLGFALGQQHPLFGRTPGYDGTAWGAGKILQEGVILLGGHARWRHSANRLDNQDVTGFHEHTGAVAVEELRVFAIVGRFGAKFSH
jgi:hypothetical protein